VSLCSWNQTSANRNSKSFQKILQKQGFKFKLNTKVLGAEVEGDVVKLKVDAAKGGKEETVSFDYRIELMISLKRMSYLFPLVDDLLQRV
jgi:hypothetical protein